jgi:hypothetical protein|tara:strand:- start:123 stop:314 length:192 start_codon:yes stop_codon:yes gene_type:complete
MVQSFHASFGLKGLNRFRRNGSNVNDAKKDTSKANAVKTPNKTVGVKFENAKIEKPAAIVDAV